MKSKLVLLSLTLVSISQAAVFTVRIVPGMKFEPAHIDIDQGDSIEFINETDGKHTVTGDPSKAADPKHVILPAGAAPYDSGTVQKLDRFTHTFDVKGHYQYICRPHERMGMMGTVDVN